MSPNAKPSSADEEDLLAIENDDGRQTRLKRHHRPPRSPLPGLPPTARRLSLPTPSLTTSASSLDQLLLSLPMPQQTGFVAIKSNQP